MISRETVTAQAERLGRSAVLLANRTRDAAAPRLKLLAFNTSAAFRFARRRLEARPALRDRHEPWRRFAVVTIALVAFAAAYFDPVFAAVPRAWRSPVHGLGQTITDFGLSGPYLIPLAIFLIWTATVDWSAFARRSRLHLFNGTAAAWYAFISIAGSGLLVTLLKQLFGRARPRLAGELGAFHFDPFSFDAAHLSFPSGHATTVGAVCFCIAILFPRLRLAAIIAALWFGFSRSVVGAHHPSDVVAGLLIGGWFAYWVAIRFGKAGLVFLLPEGRLPQRRRSFHLLPLDAHRRFRRFVHRTEAQAHRLSGKRFDGL
ncbi:phosphatase PAP2 family protein [Aquibium carbonis]|uniref:Phosphatase PAP2 family protein n=1 Tax=Aquibium carbonis TaxID=2495581 RepID=A0A3R9YUH9_9HYPH|nr:phosphatase PAP2 family protein [Aquibium carbonis]RST87412.1 phosphatase PAP2 family protein [Aquibium carbonis]